MNKREIIAEIKLAPGEVGYYDEYSRIYLTLSKPTAYVYAGTNCTQIKRSIKYGRLRLISGSFDIPNPKPVSINEPKTETVVKVETVDADTVVIDPETQEVTIKDKTQVTEQVTEQVTNQVTVTEPAEPSVSEPTEEVQEPKISDEIVSEESVEKEAPKTAKKTSRKNSKGKTQE